jgi:hypothetical protein
MAPLLAACRKHLAAALGLHAHPKAVRLGAATLARLICTLWQSNPPSIPQTVVQRFAKTFPKLRACVSRTEPLLLFASNLARNFATCSYRVPGHKTIHRPLPQLFRNLLVYSTLTHTVKKALGLSIVGNSRSFIANCATLDTLKRNPHTTRLKFQYRVLA